MNVHRLVTATSALMGIVLVVGALSTSAAAAPNKIGPVADLSLAAFAAVSIARPRAAAKVRSWRTVKGTAEDAGVGTASVVLTAIHLLLRASATDHVGNSARTVAGAATLAG